MPVVVVPDDSRFAVELASAGASLVVVDFTATWCGPCQRIAPVFEQLSNEFPNAKFLKVDVDVCTETAAANSVSSMPQFHFFRNRTRLAKIQGADPAGLEAKIRELYGSASDPSSVEGASAGADVLDGHIDLSSMVFKSGCECLNESDDHTFADCLTAGAATYLESDCDEQLIISLSFSQAVKLHSIKFDAPDNGPKNVKLFINQPRTLDFDQADSMEPVQMLELTAADLAAKNPQKLRYVKFQNVSNLQLFIKDNQNGNETTRINHLQIFGSPVATTNMADFKRIAGKKGESH